MKLWTHLLQGRSEQLSWEDSWEEDAGFPPALAARLRPPPRRTAAREGEARRGNPSATDRGAPDRAERVEAFAAERGDRYPAEEGDGYTAEREPAVDRIRAEDGHRSRGHRHAARGAAAASAAQHDAPGRAPAQAQARFADAERDGAPRPEVPALLYWLLCRAFRDDLLAANAGGSGFAAKAAAAGKRCMLALHTACMLASCRTLAPPAMSTGAGRHSRAVKQSNVLPKAALTTHAGQSVHAALVIRVFTCPYTCMMTTAMLGLAGVELSALAAAVCIMLRIKVGKLPCMTRYRADEVRGKRPERKLV